MRSRVGSANSLARPAGIAAAIAPAASGAATYKPMRGNGVPIATHPARDNAAVKPIQRPTIAAKVSLLVSLALRVTASAVTTKTIRVYVPIVPMKSSIISPLRLVTAVAMRQAAAQRSFLAARRCSRSSFAHRIR